LYKVLIVRYQERKLNYINSTIRQVNDMWTGVYESLVDGDYDQVRELLTEIKTVIDDLTKSISNEI
jgi:hypothetical protein